MAQADGSPAPTKSFKFFRASLQETLRNATKGRTHRPAVSEDVTPERERKRTLLRKHQDGGSGGKTSKTPTSSKPTVLTGWAQPPTLSQGSMSSPDLLMSLKDQSTTTAASDPSPHPPKHNLPRQRRPSQLVPISTSSSLLATTADTGGSRLHTRLDRSDSRVGASSPSSPVLSPRLHAASASTSNLASTSSPSRLLQQQQHRPPYSPPPVPHVRSPSTSMAQTASASPATPLQPRRASFQGQAASRTSPSPPSPTPQRRVVSPIYHRQNSSSASLASPPTSSPHRETIRTASAYLAKEFARRPPHFGINVWQEVEVRLRALFRLERIWGKSGTGASTGTAVGAPGSAGLGGGEERERRIFLEALRDGYVLCQFVTSVPISETEWTSVLTPALRLASFPTCRLINKFQPGMIARADAQEDGFVKTSNVTKFLSAASSFGVAQGELFSRGDLLEGTAESLGQVAQTIITVCQLSEQPRQPRSPRSPYLHSGSATSQPSLPSSVSTPNLVSRRPSSPPAPPLPSFVSAKPSATAAVQLASTSTRKRWTPPSPVLSTARTASPGDKARPPPVTTNGRRDASLTPEPRRNGSGTHISDALAAPLSSSPPRTPRPLLSRDSSSRVSIASTMATAATDMRSSRFGTIRTMNTEVTEATSFHPSDGHPSLTKSEANAVMAELDQQVRRPGLGGKFTFPDRDRSSTDSGAGPGPAVVDLGRVPEVDEEGEPRRRRPVPNPLKLDHLDASPPREGRPKAIALGKGKWPEDFIGLGLGQPPSSPMRIPMARSSSDTHALSGRRDSFGGSPGSPTTILSSTPPHRKLSIKASLLDGSPDRSANSEERPFGARRPSHRSRHSVETTQLTRDITGGSSSSSVLLPRDRSPSTALDSREGSTPSPIVPPPSSMLRRQSTTNAHSSPRGSRALKPALGNGNGSTASVNRVLFPPAPASATTPTAATMAGGVPFPSASAGIVDLGSSSRPSTADTLQGATDVVAELQRKPVRPTRHRHVSDMPDSTRRKPRPTSFDDGGGRSRYESMVSLGMGGIGSNSTNDLTRRDSMSSQMPVTTLIVREEGKPPMHYVSDTSISSHHLVLFTNILSSN